MRAPIDTSLSVKNSRFSNIFSNMSTVPNACVATVTAIDVRSDGNAGQGPSSIFGTMPPRSSSTISCCFVGTWTVSSPISTPHAELLERRHDRDEVLRTHAFDRDVAAGDRRHADEAADLDVVGPDRPRAAAETLDAGDAQDVRLDAFDLRAERDEEAAEVLHVRLARRVAEHRLALREHRGHERVLRRHDARLVEEDARAVQLVGLDLVETAAEVHARRRARWNACMCGSSLRRPITSPPGGGIVARPKRATSGPARRNEARIFLQRRSSGADFDAPRASTRTSFGPIQPASAPRSASRSSIVSTSRIRGTFESVDRTVREQAGGEDRQRAVLVSGSANRAAQAA